MGACIRRQLTAEGSKYTKNARDISVRSLARSFAHLAEELAELVEGGARGDAVELDVARDERLHLLLEVLGDVEVEDLGALLRRSRRG